MLKPLIAKILTSICCGATAVIFIANRRIMHSISTVKKCLVRMVMGLLLIFASVANAESSAANAHYAFTVALGAVALVAVVVAGVNAAASDTESEGEEPDPAEKTTDEELHPADKATFAPFQFEGGICGFPLAMPQEDKMNLRLNCRAESDGNRASGALNTAIEWRF